MQREIKFRVWDKKRRMWLHTDILFVFANCPSYNTSDFTVELKNGLCNPYQQTDKENTQEIDIVFLQYTGLKDKNRKEIYEGDVLHEFKKKTAPMANNGIDRRLVVQDIREIEYNCNNCTIIGNIYENPELIF